MANKLSKLDSRMKPASLARSKVKAQDKMTNMLTNDLAERSSKASKSAFKK